MAHSRSCTRAPMRALAGELRGNRVDPGSRMQRVTIRKAMVRHAKIHVTDRRHSTGLNHVRQRSTERNTEGLAGRVVPALRVTRWCAPGGSNHDSAASFGRITLLKVTRRLGFTSRQVDLKHAGTPPYQKREQHNCPRVSHPQNSRIPAQKAIRVSRGTRTRGETACLTANDKQPSIRALLGLS